LAKRDPPEFARDPARRKAGGLPLGKVASLTKAHVKAGG
jgi:hypothetical protein